MPKARLAFRDRTLEAKPWVSLTALEIRIDNPVLNFSGSFEDEERQKAKGRSYLSARQPACFILPFAFLLLPFLVLVLVLQRLSYA
jgi:hypothetical protein